MRSFPSFSRPLYSVNGSPSTTLLPGAFAWVALMLLLLNGCATATPQRAATLPATEAAVTLPAPATAAAFPATAVPRNTSTPLVPPATATVPAPATPPPTAPPLSLSAGASVPAGLVAAAAVLAGSQGAIWLGTESAGAAQLSLAAERPLATWIYAVVAPFKTLDDDVTWSALEEAWQSGSLYLDPETNALLQEAWGPPTTSATIVPATELVDTLWVAQSGTHPPALSIVPFDRLTARLKVLRLDGAAPIAADFDPAGYPLAFGFGWQGQSPHVAQLTASWQGPTTNRRPDLITRVALTGPAGMRRAVADRMERYGLTYPAEETGPVLQAADIAHMSNENAFAPDCPLPDPYDSVNVCNRDEYVELMVWMGISVNEMTGNHLNDWGVAALRHTFDLYDAHGIQTFGGGRDLEHARRPLLLQHNGNLLAFVGCNPVGPAFGWARENYPGALPCGDYSEIRAEISRLDAEGYLVFATVQYLEDYQYRVLQPQRQAFNDLAAAGATAVSGSHAHHPQGFAFPEGRFVHYGLGNLLADQMWSLGSRQMFIDTYLIYDGRLLNVDLWTGINEDYARVRRMTDAERRELLQTVFDYSFWPAP
jgi:hypothetical protein